MKKLFFAVLCAAFFSSLVPLYSASYDNNEFQRKSRAYTRMAEKAYDEGEYDAAVEYARIAEENAQLSVRYIEKMILRADVQTLLYRAHTRLTWAKEKKADLYFPGAYQSAAEAVFAGDELFAAEDFPGAKQLAEKALADLSVIREVVPLPAYYRVEYWATTKDCLWNIAKNPAIYDDPFLWEKLYEANKEMLKQPGNPNLVMPGMMVKIPSLKDEYREGVYDPSIRYEPLESFLK